MVRILGEKNEYMIRSFKNADFKRVYDVQLQNTSALPDTKTGKISAITDLNIATQTDPIFTKKEVVEMLDLGLDKAFTDGAENPVDSARNALDMILNGEEAPEPQRYDDLLVSYNVFLKYIQGINYKTKVNPEIKQVMETYITTLEGLMWEKSLKNPKFKMELDQIDIYPAFFEVPMDAAFMGAQPQQPPQPGQAGTQGSMNLKPMQESQQKSEEGMNE